MRRHNTPEYKAYEELRFWKPGRKILPPQALFDKKSKLFELFNYLYEQTKETYSLLPLRKNGDNSFIHPLNVVLGLKQAGIDDETTLCAGLIHDVVEEKVDLYKREKQLGSSRKDVAKLDVYEKA
jgi:(p)ppGpp synthase/HD superfamily hydrolase